MDIILLEKMPDQLNGMANPAMFLPGLRPCFVNYSCRLECSWEKFFQEKASRARRSKIRRKWKKLAEQGNLEFVVAQNEEELEEITLKMIEQKTARFESTDATNLFRDPSYTSFYLQLARRCSKCGFVHVSGLRFDNEIIATHLGLIYQGRYYLLMPTFKNGVFERYSPGLLLMVKIMELCHENNMEYIDFTLGDESFKLQWAEREMTLFTYVEGMNFKGRLFIELMNICMKMKDRFKLNCPKMYYSLKKIFS